MQITPEIVATFFGALFMGFIVMPIYYITINRLNNIIDSKKQQPQTTLEFVKVGVGAANLLVVFLLPMEVMTRNIYSKTLVENCISVHLGTFAISSILSATILFKTGRIKAIWNRPF